MSRSRIKAKGRREKGQFIALPTAVMDHPNFINLSAQGRSLLLDLMRQLRFEKGGGTKNNGDLCATFSLMKQRGWKSKDTLYSAVKELLHYGFIVVSRQGERLRNDKPTLYALTFLGVDDCGGKLDIPPSPAPSGRWKQDAEKYRKVNTVKRQKRAAKNMLVRNPPCTGTESGAESSN